MMSLGQEIECKGVVGYREVVVYEFKRTEKAMMCSQEVYIPSSGGTCPVLGGT
jgi:hypothetical protein